ncbi:hypothetical protein [Brevundimonas naejangsanensis]|uniref:hypothetical protein n=1 Tax=Brevundimonas naejangsanensis TaxID=588932 RepID=UPI00320A2934
MAQHVGFERGLGSVLALAVRNHDHKARATHQRHPAIPDEVVVSPYACVGRWVGKEPAGGYNLFTLSVDVAERPGTATLQAPSSDCERGFLSYRNVAATLSGLRRIQRLVLIFEPLSDLQAPAYLRLGSAEAGLDIRVRSIIVSDVTDRLSAANSAAAALTQSVSVSAAASEARLAANLAAQVGQGVGYHKNPTWLDWTTGSLPHGASIFTGGTTARNTASARYGVCLEVNSSDGGDSGVLLGTSRFVALGPITHVVVEYEVLLHSGSFRTAGLQATVLQGGGDKIARVHLFDEHGVGVMGQTYTGAKLVALPTAADNPSGVLLHLFNNFSSLSGGPGGAKNLRWQRVNVRAPTSAEIEAGRVQQVEAQASMALSASVDALTQLGQAAFELILASGGNPAYIKALAEPGGIRHAPDRNAAADAARRRVCQLSDYRDPQCAVFRADPGRVD